MIGLLLVNDRYFKQITGHLNTLADYSKEVIEEVSRFLDDVHPATEAYVCRPNSGWKVGYARHDYFKAKWGLVVIDPNRPGVKIPLKTAPRDTRLEVLQEIRLVPRAVMVKQRELLEYLLVDPDLRKIVSEAQNESEPE